MEHGVATADVGLQRVHQAGAVTQRHLMAFAGPAAVPVIPPAGQQGGEHTVLHVEQRHRVVHHHLGPGRQAPGIGQQVRQLGGVEIEGRGEGVQPAAQHLGSGQPVGHVQGEVAHRQQIALRAPVGRELVQRPQAAHQQRRAPPARRGSDRSSSSPGLRMRGGATATTRAPAAVRPGRRPRYRSARGCPGRRRRRRRPEPPRPGPGSGTARTDPQAAAGAALGAGAAGGVLPRRPSARVGRAAESASRCSSNRRARLRADTGSPTSTGRSRVSRPR